MKNNRKNAFTLVEVLVAVAVLVIMMTFIFQYTASAQRLWAVNTARTEMSAQADALFQLLEEDLGSMYVVQKDEEIDAQAGWYCCHKKVGGSNNDTYAFPINEDTGKKLTGYNLLDFCFFTEDPDPESTGANTHATVYPVRYHFDYEEPGEIYEEGRGKLYRYVDEKRQWDKVRDNFMPYFGFLDEEDPNAEYRGRDPENYAKTPDTDAEKEEFLIAENVKSIRIYSDAAVDEEAITGIPYGEWDEEIEEYVSKKENQKVFRKKPSWFRVEITISVPENLRNGATKDENTDRSFSRVFQLDQ